MSVRAEIAARGTALEDLAFFGDMETLPYSLDSPVWANALYLSLEGGSDAPARTRLEFATRLELLDITSDAPARASLNGLFAGHGWITRAM